jgi:hypothetical protein
MLAAARTIAAAKFVTILDRSCQSLRSAEHAFDQVLLAIEFFDVDIQAMQARHHLLVPFDYTSGSQLLSSSTWLTRILRRPFCRAE